MENLTQHCEDLKSQVNIFFILERITIVAFDGRRVPGRNVWLYGREIEKARG